MNIDNHMLSDAPNFYSEDCEWVVETTHGYYHDRRYGWCCRADNKEDGVTSMNHWHSKGDDVRLYNNKTGEIIYPIEIA